jgi:hypothetical protein
MIASVAVPALNVLCVWLGLGFTAQKALKYSVNLFFAISSPFEVKYPYSIMALLCTVSGYAFVPNLLASIVDQMIKRTEDETKLWVAAYRDAEKTFPERNVDQLKEIADKIVREAKVKRPKG